MAERLFARPSGKRKRVVSVFSDVLVLCKARKGSTLEYRELYPLQKCRCRWVPDVTNPSMTHNRPSSRFRFQFLIRTYDASHTHAGPQLSTCR